ncbi:MAG TPA: pyridoxal phosphate-dependent aminotransferase [Aestuariivirga sp.]
MTSFTHLIDSLPSTVPFVGPETILRRTGIPLRARIGANESVFGPSPKAIAAMQEAAFESWKYGDAEVYDLREAIAKHHQISIENVTVGEGIDGLIGLAVRLFVEPGVTVANSYGAYPTYNFHVAGFGGRFVTTPYVNDHEDPASLLALAKKEKARLIYFANPDNPMGTCWKANVVQDLIDNIPTGSLLMLDEAYHEFAECTVPTLDMANPNVLHFRTFSKAYGMAGVRVGYALGHPHLISAFDKIRNHFGVNRMGQAGAIAALADQDYLITVQQRVARAREKIYAIARFNGFGCVPSSTNFVAVDCGRDGAYAGKILEGLAAHGIFVRMPGVAPLNHCIRISVGTDENLAALEEALPLAIKAAG